MKPVRCAVYTRKSSEEGLEQEFNSLHAQREACEAYILSQKHEGWQLIPTAYDDGGYSGGNMERPGLKALLADVEAGLVDTIVVYKVDRLSRSLADFARMVDRFDAHSVSFVSVTQAFNTTSSMGRLTLNVLLSFAQFEREVTGERIRDKIAASKAKGMWMGGLVPLGYDLKERQLVANEVEAEQVRTLFARYLKLRAVDDLVIEAAAHGIHSKVRVDRSGATTGGTPLGRGSLYTILANPLYVGDVPHKGKTFPGQHQAIVERGVFDAAQALLASNRRKRPGTTHVRNRVNILAGLVWQAGGGKLGSTHTSKGGRRYRYYAAGDLRIPANDLETLVLDATATTLRDPQRLAALLPSLSACSTATIRAAARLAGQGDSSLTALIARVLVAAENITIELKLDALGLEGTIGTIVQPSHLGKGRAGLALVVPAASGPAPDSALIGIVAQARHWFDALATGRARSLTELGMQAGVGADYVRQLIGAAFLAPDLVTAIVQGRQPRALDAERFKAMLPLPSDWQAQRALFAQIN